MPILLKYRSKIFFPTVAWYMLYMCFFTDVLNTRYSSESENDQNFQEMMSINILRLSAIIVTWNETISDFTGDKVTGRIPFEGNAEFPSEASENKDVILFPFKFRDLLHTRRGSIGNLWTQVKTPWFYCLWLIFPTLWLFPGFTGNQPVSWRLAESAGRLLNNKERSQDPRDTEGLQCLRQAVGRRDTQKNNM